ncbi:hypothetical protein [Metamycoplasma hyosynoviae]|uniref:Uncharacterized protein n=1 Tax=Metamycoplasma hyosynoviae TaxID=29559 RepID=A0A4P1QG29_9BACT|nr:hypothetical protein [Metamycoplasma hyosynoviae]ASI53720.1 hypothetical protein MHSN_00600 [Metamycoplasma hyosynoviae]MDC8937657.1 hypothetical protein [Metamycoplasma hyosynoviae]MDD1359904.1 hypothetical protein [Metamycoplasma hyosynoviae]MDD1360452.1 hypothetical protein [Metamycoplasma hyosynoviae]MDD1361792.1 hypothetical protein [Metamycoplasma hyosynoviae]
MNNKKSQEIEEFVHLVDLYSKYKEFLPTSQKQVLYLKLYEDLNFTEISEELAMSRAGAFDAYKKGVNKLIKISKKLLNKG